jgi:excisionase family DNA binding protein
MPEGSNEVAEVLLTTAGAAKLLGVSPDTVRRRVVPTTRTPGGHRRFARSMVTALVRELTGAGPALAAA